MNDEKAGLILNGIGLAVVELVAAQAPITKYAIVDRLEHNRSVKGNVKGKVAKRDDAELVMKGH